MYLRLVSKTIRSRKHGNLYSRDTSQDFRRTEIYYESIDTMDAVSRTYGGDQDFAYQISAPTTTFFHVAHSFGSVGSSLLGL